MVVVAVVLMDNHPLLQVLVFLVVLVVAWAEALTQTQLLVLVIK